MAMKQIRLGLSVLVAVLVLVGCSGPSSSTEIPATNTGASTTAQPSADKQKQPTALPSTVDTPKVDVQEKLGQLTTFLKDNYTGTTWFSQFSEVKLAMSGSSATITVLTKFFPKDSNKESAKNACRGAMMSGVETLGASKITVEIMAEGGSVLTRCWADVTNGKLATPMQFSN